MHKFGNLRFNGIHIQTRPDTRLPQSRAGGQGPYLRSLDHLGRSSEAKQREKNRSPRGNMWSAIPIALLCMIVNWSERKQGGGPVGVEVL